MPKIVDHEERRNIVASAAIEAIGAKGVEVTLREISALVGASTRTISHYFASKQEMLRFTFQAAHERVMARARALSANSDDPLTASCLAFLPFDRECRNWWRVWFTLGDMAADDAEFARSTESLHQAGMAEWRLLLLNDIASGRSIPDLDVELASRLLMTAAFGVAKLHLADPKQWQAEDMAAVMTAQIRSVRGLQVGPEVAQAVG